MSGYESETRGNNTMSLKQYVKLKLRMLERDFHIKMSPSEIKHMQSLKNVIQIDNYARDLIFKK